MKNTFLTRISHWTIVTISSSSLKRLAADSHWQSLASSILNKQMNVIFTKKREVISGAKYMTTLALIIHSRCSLGDQTAQWDWITLLLLTNDNLQSERDLYVNAWTKTNGTMSVMLHHFGSFVCAVSPQQPNRCLTTVILTANSSSRHTNAKWFLVTQSGSFYKMFFV